MHEHTDNNSRIRPLNRNRNTNPSVGEREHTKQRPLFRALAQIRTWARHHGRHDGEDDPDQHGDVPENLNLKSHQLANGSVVWRSQVTYDNTEDCRRNTARNATKKV